MISFLGISFKSKASVEEIMRVLSIFANGNEIGFDPVAITAFLKETDSIFELAFI